MAGISKNLNPFINLEQQSSVKGKGVKKGKELQPNTNIKSQINKPCYAQRRNRYDGNFAPGDWYESCGMSDDGRRVLFKYTLREDGDWSISTSFMTEDEFNNWRYM